jgi:O-antigen biosynthesis protein
LVRPLVAGKFIHAGEDKLYVRGVTYGTFEPRGDSEEFPRPDVVAQDFAAMSDNGVNALRTYTVPPHWLLDLAGEHGLRVLVGTPWEQHVAFLDDWSLRRSIEQSVREGARSCAGHPAVLGYAIGNEIPAPIVRWHGRRKVERFLERLYMAAKEADPDGLVTYVNYPSTEYLQLPFLDLVCFNVFLEEEEKLEAYLARLQNLAGDRPLLVTELGLDSRRHGRGVQALSLEWQIRTAFRAGCAGSFVFAWTDEWHRAGADVVDWDFGLTDRNRQPKPALAAMRCAYDDVPFPADLPWPRISVVVCTHNGAETLADCLAGVAKLDYPDFETIVVDDGSTDGSGDVAAGFDVRLLRTDNRGLSSARNTGLEAATGEIVAYLDDDARPDGHWLRYLAATFLATSHVGVGGPNVPPAPAGLLERSLALAPGGPIHVLLSDREAEHIPGCNMAFRKDALEAIGRFDARFRVAGDDVDVCWRLRDNGWTLGFNPGAMVWHRRRPTIRAYLRQQRGYGKAEALLERKWPERYNRSGHLRWSGDVYPGRLRQAIGLNRWRIYYGTWGNGLFQSVYQRAPGTLWSLPMMPEWYLLLALLAALAAYEVVVQPVLFGAIAGGVSLSVLLLTFCAGVLLAQTASAARSLLPSQPRARSFRIRFLAVMTVLHLLQPAARLGGRLRQGLTPWRQRGDLRLAPPWPRHRWIWSELWRSSADWLGSIEDGARQSSTAVHRGGEYDRWDLEARVGALGSARLRLAVEEHGQGRQLLRFRIWPVWSRLSIVLAVGLGFFIGLQGLHSAAAATVVAGIALVLGARALREAGAAIALFLDEVKVISAAEGEAPERLALGESLALARHANGVAARTRNGSARVGGVLGAEPPLGKASSRELDRSPA